MEDRIGTVGGACDGIDLPLGGLLEGHPVPALEETFFFEHPEIAGSLLIRTGQDTDNSAVGAKAEGDRDGAGISGFTFGVAGFQQQSAELPPPLPADRIIERGSLLQLFKAGETLLHPGKVRSRRILFLRGGAE